MSVRAFHIKRLNSTNGADIERHIYRLESGETIETFFFRVGGKPVTTVWEVDSNQDHLIHWAEGVTDTKEAMRQAGYSIG